MAESNRSEPCVLLVEDFVDAREMYEMYLQHAGFCVYTAENATRGLELALEHRPDLIIMDAALPGMTGFQAVEKLKADERLKHTPVFMLTGHVLTESREKARAVGADGFIAKPCLPDALLAIIKTALSHSGQPGPWPTEGPPVAPSSTPANAAKTRKG